MTKVPGPDRVMRRKAEREAQELADDIDWWFNFLANMLADGYTELDGLFQVRSEVFSEVQNRFRAHGWNLRQEYCGMALGVKLIFEALPTIENHRYSLINERFNARNRFRNAVHTITDWVKNFFRKTRC